MHIICLLNWQGTFEISVTANPGVNLSDVEKAIFESFDMFEKKALQKMISQH